MNRNMIGRMGRTSLVILALGVAVAAHAQVVPGYTVELYAKVTDPVKINFHTDGNLFVGRDNTGSGGGGGDDVKIHRVGPGGSPVVEYGADPIHDPDVVIVDKFGKHTGVAGTVLVAGGKSDTPGDNALITAIDPSEAISVLFDTGLIHNPGDMEFDINGDILITDLESSNIAKISGGTITVFFSDNGIGSLGMAVDSAGNIYTNGLDGVIRVHDQFGNMINPSFTSGLQFNSDMTFGSGILGGDMLAMDNGRLLRIDGSGGQTVIGTGFSTISSLTYGDDGYLYISDFTTDRVLRIVPEPATMIALGAGIAGLIARRRRK